MIYILRYQKEKGGIPLSLGMRIKTLRKAKGYTQQELAERTGVSRIYVQALESNRRLPSMKLLNRMAESLDVEVTDLVQSMPADKSGRLHLEEVLDNTAEVEVWYRSKRLTSGEIQLVQRLIDAALSKWEEEGEDVS